MPDGLGELNKNSLCRQCAIKFAQDCAKKVKGSPYVKIVVIKKEIKNKVKRYNKKLKRYV